MKKVSPLIKLITVTLLIVFLYYLPYIITNTPFEYGGDLKPQGFTFFTEFKSLISFSKLMNGILPFYSWDFFLGTNFWASKTYYIVSDIFSYISLLIPLHFYSTYALITGFKVIMAACLFYLYLSTFTTHIWSRILSSIAYAFSAWMIYFYGQTSFISYYVLMPLLLYSTELFLKKNKSAPFVLSVALLLLTNFLFFYSSSIFLVFYFTYRYLILNKSINGFIKKTLYLLLLYIIGVFISSIFILPSFYYMLENDRVGNSVLSLFYSDPKIYMHLLSSLFVPSHVFIYGNNVFETNYHISREIVLWSGSLSALLLPQILADKDVWFKKITIIFYSCLLIILFTPIGGSIMNGFSEFSFRWTLSLIAMNLVMMVRYTSNPSLINHKVLRNTYLFALLIVITAVPLTLILSGEINLIQNFLPQIGLFILVSIILTIYYFALKIKTERIYIILFILLSLELSTSSFYILGYSRLLPLFSWNQVNEATHVLQDNQNELNDFLDSLDEENYASYYRVYIPHDSLYWSYSHNMSVFYQVNGLMTYDSTYATSLNDLKHLAPQVMEFGSDWIFNIKDPVLMNFLSVKYAIVTSENEVPFINKVLITDQYRGSLKIYLNLDYRSIGTTYNKYVDGTSYYRNGLSELNLLLDSVLVRDEDKELLSINANVSQGLQLEEIQYGDNHLSGKLDSDGNGLMVLTLPYDEGWQISINGTNTNYYRVNGGFIGIPIQAGLNELEMYFIPKGFKVGFILSCLGTLICFYLIYRDLKINKIYKQKNTY